MRTYRISAARLQRLHRVGGCYWARGAEVADSEALGVVSPEQYNAACKPCWPDLGGTAGSHGADIGLEDQESDSSLSDESTG